MQDEVAESKVYTRKLEARLDELKGQADLSSKLQVAKGKVRHALQLQLLCLLLKSLLRLQHLHAGVANHCVHTADCASFAVQRLLQMCHMSCLLHLASLLAVVQHAE